MQVVMVVTMVVVKVMLVAGCYGCRLCFMAKGSMAVVRGRHPQNLEISVSGDYKKSRCYVELLFL